MLIKFDDYPAHQTHELLSYLATSERNAYARYWYNAYDFEGDFYFGIAFAMYPNREVMDGAVSIVRKDGTQDSFRASRRLRGDRTDMYAGPMRHEIVEPMRIATWNRVAPSGECCCDPDVDHHAYRLAPASARSSNCDAQASLVLSVR